MHLLLLRVSLSFGLVVLATRTALAVPVRSGSWVSVEERLEQVMAARPQADAVHELTAALVGLVLEHVEQAPPGREYRVGEWTRWWPNNDPYSGRYEYEKALLVRDPGEETWRVSIRRTDSHARAIVEARIDRRKTAPRVAALRRWFPGDADPVAVPIDRMRDRYEPRRPPAQAGRGQVVFWANLEVPAGKYRVSEYRFVRDEERAQWWCSEKVPGGVVRYMHYRWAKEPVVDLILSEKGSGARSALGR